MRIAIEEVYVVDVTGDLMAVEGTFFYPELDGPPRELRCRNALGDLGSEENEVRIEHAGDTGRVADHVVRQDPRAAAYVAATAIAPGCGGLYRPAPSAPGELP